MPATACALAAATAVPAVAAEVTAEVAATTIALNRSTEPRPQAPPVSAGFPTGRPRAWLKPYPDGAVRRQYWCQPGAVRGGCGRIAVDQRELDRHAGALVVRILADPRHAEALEAAAEAMQDKRRLLLVELSECEHLADELSGWLGRREITLRAL
ncbi:MAG: hypothetical protein ACRDUV_22065 [Pseudonocardiaceae bacterium]